MVVTADPLGDYNSTSQILRYSALARDVAVPRAPSAAESILSGTLRFSRGSADGRSSPNAVSNEELDNALADIARLTSENESLSVRLAEEEIARAEVEMRLRASEERCLMIDQEVREECYAEMDEKMEEERRRWQSAWDDQVRRVTLICCLVHADQDRPDIMMSTWIRRLNYSLAVFRVRIPNLHPLFVSEC